MNAVLLTLGILCVYLLMYRFYHRYVARRIFGAREGELTPAHQFNDGVDYVPTKRHVLWGHHFSSIAGAAPIVGPAIAVIWGWVPAILWVVLGSILIGAVHDSGTLILSAKRKGKTIADITGGLLNVRARNLFLGIIVFLTWTVIAVFALIIAVLFQRYPRVVIPINAEIILALFLGWWGYRKRKSLLIPSIIALIIMYSLIPVGLKYPIVIPPWFGSEVLQSWGLSLGLPAWFGSTIMIWIFFLLIYSFVASVLPVWTLLQPRDFINSHQLILGLGLMYTGFFLAKPHIVAPAFNTQPVGAPSLWPFLFITIACGAISGFHGLVSSGTTSKQLDKMDDACSIGCGSMIGEGLLAVMAVLACTAGFTSRGAWYQHYASWNQAQGLLAKLNAFIDGTGNFIGTLGIPNDLAQAVVVVIIISFAATTLDTATRIQRLILGEIGESLPGRRLPSLFQNRYFGSAFAVVSSFALLVSADEGKGGLILWPLFGATNQLIAALGLSAVTYWLIKKRSPSFYTGIPLLFLSTLVLWAIFSNTLDYYRQGTYLLFWTQIAIIGMVVWFTVEWLKGLWSVKGLHRSAP